MEKIVELIDKYWKFDKNMHSKSSFVDKQNLIEEIKMVFNNSNIHIIELKSKGKILKCLIDKEDIKKIQDYHWYISRGNYVMGYIPGHRETKIPIHRVILGLFSCNNLVVDHKNHNPLDNRKENLRICTHRQNLCNQKPRGRSKYLGVYIFTKAKKKPFGAKIMVDYKNIFLGTFASEVEAAKAYDKAAKKYHKEFANLNFPQT